MPMLRKVGIVTFILAMASATAMACDCVVRSEAESFARADEVFIGKVTNVIHFASRVDTVFEISRSLKGHKRESVVISSHRSNCDGSFIGGYTYEVYAKNINGELFAGICSGTRLIGKVPGCADVYHPYTRSYREIAVITASSVALSLALGMLVGTIKRRFRK